MRNSGLQVHGTLEDVLREVDVIVACTPKKVAAGNAGIYRRCGVKYIVQGGEKHSATGHSFVAESNYASALGRGATRVVSCNTTSLVRTLSALKRADLLRKARGTLLRRATDPWESHLNGIMNTLVPEAEIPSHQGPDAQTVDPELDVVTMAVKVPRPGVPRLRCVLQHGVHAGRPQATIRRASYRRSAALPSRWKRATYCGSDERQKRARVTVRPR